MEEERIEVPEEVVKKLKAMIKKEVSYEVPSHPYEGYGHDTIYDSPEDALEHLKKAWIKEQQKKSEWLFCPSCDVRLDVPRNLNSEHKEILARLRAIRYYIIKTLDHMIKYEVKKGTWKTGRMTPEGIAKMKAELKAVQKRLTDLIHGTLRDRSYFVGFPKERVLIDKLGEKET